MSNSRGFQVSGLKDTLARLFGEGGRFRWVPFVILGIYAGNLATALVLTALSAGVMMDQAVGVLLGAGLLTIGPFLAFALARRALPESIQANPRWYIREFALFITVFVGHAAAFLAFIAYRTVSLTAYTPDAIALGAVAILAVVLTPGPTLAILAVRRWLI